MKKVLAFAAISLSLIACKKEGKTTETKTEGVKRKQQLKLHQK